MLDIETGKVKDFVKFDLGNLAMCTGGHNNGRVGTIVHKEKHKGVCEGWERAGGAARAAPAANQCVSRPSLERGEEGKGGTLRAKGEQGCVSSCCGMFGLVLWQVQRPQPRFIWAVLWCRVN